MDTTEYMTKHPLFPNSEEEATEELERVEHLVAPQQGGSVIKSTKIWHFVAIGVGCLMFGGAAGIAIGMSTSKGTLSVPDIPDWG